MYVFKELSQRLLLYQTFHIVISTGICLSLDTLELERPGKNLCVNKSVDCSNQVKSTGSSSARCNMRFLRANSTECRDSEFKGGVDTTEDFGTVSLNPFLWYESYIPHPNLNITFSKIHWKILKMRYVQVGSAQTQLCRQFEVSEDIDPSSVISFDCLWNGNSAGEQYKFEYILVSKDNRTLSHSYMLQMPTDSDVDPGVGVEKFHVFIMMDTTSYPVIRAKMQVPPQRLNVSNIIVTLNYKEHLNGISKPQKYVSVDVTSKGEGEFITVYTHDTDNNPGIYYFTAHCQSTFGRSCIESSTPPLEIIAPKMDFQLKLSVGLLAVGAVGMLVFYVLRRKRQIVHNGKPNVLFVYESTYPSHIENIYKFKEFLDWNCSINSKLDLTDIPKSDSMNPWKWYYKTFEDADYVLLFASPKEGTEKGVHEDNVYHNLQTYALRLLVNYLLNKHKFVVASIRLPGCSWKTLPPEVAGLISKSSRFVLPEKLDRMCEFMNLPAIPNGASAFLTALQQPRRHPQITLPRTVPPTRLPQAYPSDNDCMELVLPNWIHLNIDGLSSSEEDEDEGETTASMDGFNL